MSPTRAITLDEYLQILRSASAESHPFLRTEYADSIGPAFVTLAHAMADFVDTFRVAVAEDGYHEARLILEDLVHTFPVPQKQEDPAEALLKALLGVGLDARPGVPSSDAEIDAALADLFSSVAAGEALAKNINAEDDEDAEGSK